MLNKDLTYAIVGASNNQKKFGYKVFKDLSDGGYKVVPINPNEKKILGKKAYHTLSAYITHTKSDIDVVIFVVPPQVTEKILQEVKDLNIKNVWMQPGAQSDAAINFCKQNEINCTHDACIMIKRLTS